MPEDLDPVETREWLDALDSVLEFDGVDRAAFLLDELHDEARRHGVPVPLLGEHPVPEHHPGRQAAAAPGRPGDRAPRSAR